MNRAETRRQQRLARKAAKSDRPARLAGTAPEHQALLFKQAEAMERAVRLHQAGQLSQAEQLYRQILQANAEHPIALYLLGVIAHQTGQNRDAVALISKAVAIKPDYPEAHYNLGNALRDLGELDKAVVSYGKALATKPDFAEAHNNLGSALRELGRPYDSFKCHRRAIALNPKSGLFWAGLAASVEPLSFSAVDDGLLDVLSHLLVQPTVRPSNVIGPIISALLHHPGLARVLDVTRSGRPETEIACQDLAEQLSAIPLFLQIMRLSPIRDLKLEGMLTVLRFAALQAAKAGRTDEKGLPFLTALALQCFTNEYVYSETDEERAVVDRLAQETATMVEKKEDIPPSLVAILGAYRPLHGFAWAQQLCERAWPGVIKDLIRRQIIEPLEERSLRPRIVSLTSIRDTVSVAVREQYEENPYPRWIKASTSLKGDTIDKVLRGAPLRLDLGDYKSPESPEVLVAGCGTGQHAIHTATRFSNARVLAIDLSLSSLSYALRKTEELGFSNIEYAQADIMELGTLERRFDLIESAGVLHHLDDPLAGWRVLTGLLRPGGLMKIGLYSEMARRHIAAVRSWVAERGIATSPEDIRRYRQDIIAEAEGGNSEMAKTCRSKDFFSLSDCRDLLFHVQEHRFTLPQIEAALRSLDLRFLGFEFRGLAARRKFRKAHRGEDDLTSLSLWHAFEVDNPDTFQGMYQFWCRKL